MLIQNYDFNLWYRSNSYNNFYRYHGKAVIVVPGYMPTKQFLVTIDFMASGKWKGKDRKNGEVYEALKAFYIANGIDVKSKAQ